MVRYIDAASLSGANHWDLLGLVWLLRGEVIRNDQMVLPMMQILPLSQKRRVRTGSATSNRTSAELSSRDFFSAAQDNAVHQVPIPLTSL